MKKVNRSGKASFIRVFLIFIVFAALIHGRYVNNPFLHDDLPTIRDNIAIKSLENLPHFFADPALFSSAKQRDMYRPLLLVTYAINYAISGLNPWSYRVFNLLICVLNAALLVMLLGKFEIGQTRGSAPTEMGGIIGQTRRSAPTEMGGIIGQTRRSATTEMLGKWGMENPYYLIVGALFLAHPITGYCFRLVSTRSALLLTLFVLLGLIVHLRATKEGTTRGLFWFVLSLLCMALGLMSVSAAVVFPVVVLLVEIGRLRADWKRIAARAAPYVLMAVLYILWRAWFLGRPFGEHYVRPVDKNLLLQCNAWWIYVKFTFFPIQMPWYVELNDPRTAFEPGVLLSILGLLIWTILGIKYLVSRDNSQVGVFLLWPLASYIPYALIPLNLPVAYHHYYLSLMGLMMLGAVLISRLGRRALISACVALLCLAALNHISDGKWENNLRWAGDAVREEPESGRAWNDLGLAYAADERFGKAVSAYQIALQKNRNLPDIHYNLGIAYFYMNRHSESIEQLEYYQTHPAWRDPNPQVSGLIGMDLVRMGKVQEAMPYLETGLKAIPDSVELLSHKAWALTEMGRTDEAIKTYDMVFGISSDYLDAFTGRAELALRAGDIEGALKYADQAERRFGVHPDIAYVKARALIKAGRPEEALSALDETLKKFEGRADLWMLSGDTLADMGRKEEALKMYSRAISLPMPPEDKERALQRILEIKTWR